MALEIVPAQDVPLPEQARVFSDAFTGYVGGSFAMDSAGLARFICAQGAELCFSRFVRNAERLCGFGYITRTGDVARVSGMGVVPQARRQGVARKLLLHLIAEAKARGDRLMVLEVIDQNPAAHALYRSEGFRELTRLCGWRRAAGSAPNEAADNSIKLKEISAVAASQLPSALEFPDLPWQISRHAIRKLPAARAYSSGAGFVVLDDPGADRLMRVGALATIESRQMNWPAVRAVLAATIRRHPKREFTASAVFPEQFGEEIFAPLGFIREPLSQFLMRHDLSAPDTGTLR